MAKIKYKDLKKMLKDGGQKKNPLKQPSHYDLNCLKSASEIRKKLKELKRREE